MSEPDTTAERLVAAAERLFAESGEAGTSLRAIARAAHANAAAVHYHFRGRDELARAVLDRQIAPLTSRRLQALEDLAASNSGYTTPEILAAILRPDLELLAKLRRKKVGIARFIGRANTMNAPAVTALLHEQFESTANQAVPMLQHALPEIPVQVLRQRLRLVLSLVTVAFASAPDPGHTGPLGADDVSTQLAQLVAFCAGGLSTPAPSDGPHPDNGRSTATIGDSKRRRK